MKSPLWLRPVINMLVTIALCCAIIVLVHENPKIESPFDPKILLCLVIAALWTHSGKDQLRRILKKSGAPNEK